MSLLDNYIDKDVVKHFATLIHEKVNTPLTLFLGGKDLWRIFLEYKLYELLPGNLTVVNDTDLGLLNVKRQVIDKAIRLITDDRVIITIKDEYLNISGNHSTLKGQLKNGADIRIVDDILGAMVVASRKRRNIVIFPITGYEDEALITAAGLAKSKTVGFRNFFVLNSHLSLAGIVNHLAKEDNQLAAFIVPLKVGLNTGAGRFSNIALTYNKGVVFSGYEPMEIMQAIWMAVSNEPAVSFQRTKEVSEEVINRSRWMLDEVFEPVPLKLDKHKIIDHGFLRIKEKYQDFDTKYMKPK